MILKNFEGSTLSNCVFKMKTSFQVFSRMFCDLAKFDCSSKFTEYRFLFSNEKLFQIASLPCKRKRDFVSKGDLPLKENWWFPKRLLTLFYKKKGGCEKMFPKIKWLLNEFWNLVCENFKSSFEEWLFCWTILLKQKCLFFFY